ncbi:MAG TPA: M23 family metallopeptidase [Rhizomicrobium sp.]|jgi:murein DD-endopeptidase MepM/ murein hydrolase activator NlpD|nr:M23 family metallopeptidase [Rhizomicrobium sp.]
MIAGSIAWLAVGTTPPGNIRGFNASSEKTLLPYQLFQKLVRTNGNTSAASIGPFGSVAGRNGAAKSATQLDDLLAAQESGDADDQTSGVETRTITMDRGDTLAGALEEAGISASDATAAVAALEKVFSPRNLRAGQAFDLVYSTDVQKDAQSEAPGNSLTVGDEDSEDAGGAIEPATTTPVNQLLSVTFSPSVEHDITIARDASGAFTASDVEKKLEAHVHRAGATIDSSLYLAAMRAGIPADVVVEMIHMFSYEVDFQRDIKPGDSFEVFYNYYYTPDGQPARQGNISYATMHLGSRTVTLYRYQPDPNEPADYFNAKGQSAKSMLMKTPVDGARISSGFGMRFHPVLGYSRMHKGIDFAVPVGTPVMAAGSGVVQIAGRLGGYGNYLRINHQNGYGTAYGHLSRLAPGIHPGSRVHQGQIVAYSGNTGMSTGPHLHYEILVDGNQVNPLRVKVATGRMLVGKQLRDFLGERIHIDAQLASMPLETKVADISTDLRQAKAK